MLIWDDAMGWKGSWQRLLSRHTYCIHSCTEEFQLYSKTNSSLLAAVAVTIQCRDSLAPDEIARMFPGF